MQGFHGFKVFTLLLLVLKLLVNIQIVHLILVLEELVHHGVVRDDLFVDALFNDCLDSLVLVSLPFFSVWVLHMVEHVADILLEGVITPIVVTRVIHFSHAVAVGFKLLVVAVFVASAINRGTDASA